MSHCIHFQNHHMKRMKDIRFREREWEGKAESAFAGCLSYFKTVWIYADDDMSLCILWLRAFVLRFSILFVHFSFFFSSYWCEFVFGMCWHSFCHYQWWESAFQCDVSRQGQSYINIFYPHTEFRIGIHSIFRSFLERVSSAFLLSSMPNILHWILIV